MEANRHVLFDAAKEMQSPRFRAILRATSGRRFRSPAEVKSFSHELNSKGSPHLPIQKLHGHTTPEDIMKVIRPKFNRLKQEVNCELGVFAGDLVGILENATDDNPQWRDQVEDLLVTSQKCAEMSPDDFWQKCEGIVQNLDDRRQELPMGILKQAHTRLLFILTRCTRLLQFHQESALAEEEHVLGLHQFSDLGFYPEQLGGKSAKDMKERLLRKRFHEHKLSGSYTSEDFPGRPNRISSWKKLPSAAEKNQKKIYDSKDEPFSKKVFDSLPPLDKSKVAPDVTVGRIDESKSSYESVDGRKDSSLKSQVPYSGDHQGLSNEIPKMICRVCEFEIQTQYAEGHFRVCTVADRCDLKGLSIDERLEKVGEILEKIKELCMPKVSDNAVINHEAERGISASCLIEVSDHRPPVRNNMSRPGSADTIDFSPEVHISAMPNRLNGLPSLMCGMHHTAAVDHGMVALSSGSRTPQSPLLTPRTNLMDLLLTGKDTFSELENSEQIQSLINLARGIALIKTYDYNSLEYMSSCLEELNAVIDGRKVDGLVVETFGRRIEKLLQEKFIHLCSQIDDENKDSPSSVIDEDSVENGSSRSSRMNPLGAKFKDRTSIEDFEIIKPISRGAFGRVFLAKKRITGDLFSIKVLKKADTIRKNAVESILAERNILISARNPFVVRFYYSFTCRENLYLVMEYISGGDLYSLLRNLGCLEEEMARTYIAEVVLALEYLHSLNVIHRDLKPDNLLISRDGHIKLTDFGLSKVGLINSTDDLSGPDVSSAALLGDHEEMVPAQRAQKREERRKQSAVGTPDYLAPEILLGMPHGPSADWWSVGIVLFELLVGIPPFNAEHPQKIFDNIMNRDIPWPPVPEEMSPEARDLIDKLLIQNPLQRLGATGSGEVKAHAFFKDINWDMLAMQKAAFIPSPEGEEDTSYFTSRHAWNASDERINRTTSNVSDDLTDCSMSCSSSPISYEENEDGDQCSHFAEFGAPTLNVKYSFSNFSFKNLSQLDSMNYDLITKCSKDYEDAHKDSKDVPDP